MPLLLIRGKYRVQGSAPDGDTVRFYPDDPSLWARVPGGVSVNSGGGANLRLEGVDALETHYQVKGLGQLHQNRALAEGAASGLLDFLGFRDVQRNSHELITAAQPEATPGFIMTRFADKYGRCTAVAFRGETALPDGGLAHLDVATFRTSLNHALAEQGLVYPTYYRLFYPDLRRSLTAAVKAARGAASGVWAADATTAGFTLDSLEQLQNELVILPKLFRRLAEFLGLQGGDPDLTGFPAFLQAKRDRLWLLSEGHSTGFDNVLEVQGQQVRLLHPPEDLVFDEQASTPAPQG